MAKSNTLIELFQRRTSGGELMREVDGLRFIAIFLVLTSHTWANWTRYSGDNFVGYPTTAVEELMLDALFNGKMGVLLFFVISGFILALPWINHYSKGGPDINLKQYYIRRLTRLEPPYVVLMILYYVALSYAGRLDYVADFPHLLASLTYTHNIIYGSFSEIYPAAWSLEVEFQFYVLAPFLFMGLFRQSPIVRRLIMLSGIILFAWISNNLDGYPGNLLFYFHYFLAGALMADLFLCEDMFSGRRSLVFDGVAILGFMLMLFVFERLATDPISQLGYTIGCCLLFVAAFNSIGFRAFLRYPPIFLIGGMCYTIYLVHGRVLTGIFNYLVPGSTLTGTYLYDHLILILVLTPIMISVSAVFYLLIEKPAMNPNWPQQLASSIRGFRLRS